DRGGGGRSAARRALGRLYANGGGLSSRGQSSGKDEGSESPRDAPSRGQQGSGDFRRQGDRLPLGHCRAGDGRDAQGLDAFLAGWDAGKVVCLGGRVSAHHDLRPVKQLIHFTSTAAVCKTASWVTFVSAAGRARNACARRQKAPHTRQQSATLKTGQ